MKSLHGFILAGCILVTIVLTSGFFIKKDVVKICGKVYFDEYQKGRIEIFFRTPETLLEYPYLQRGQVISEAPGEYCLSVPRHIDAFYVCARCNAMDEKSDDYTNSVAYYMSELLHSGRMRNKENMNIVLEPRRMMMGSYQGPTVTLSGKVEYDAYKKGLVVVAVETARNHKKIYWPPDIARETYLRPGEFSIKVPQNAGDSYVQALIFPGYPRQHAGDMPGVLRGSYQGNPIRIGLQDIKDIKVTIR